MESNRYDPRELIVNWGVVFRGDLDDIKHLKKHIADFLDKTSIRLIYQSTNPNRMWIKSETKIEDESNDKDF